MVNGLHDVLDFISTCSEDELPTIVKEINLRRNALTRRAGGRLTNGDTVTFSISGKRGIRSTLNGNWTGTVMKVMNKNVKVRGVHDVTGNVVIWTVNPILLTKVD